jgi:hypothetical protein
VCGFVSLWSNEVKRELGFKEEFFWRGERGGKGSISPTFMNQNKANFTISQLLKTYTM